MRLRLTPRAVQDLIDIADYLQSKSPSGALNVRAAILASLQLLTEAPRMGRLQSVEGVRKHVTRRYSYLVYYTVDDAADEIAVLTIQHPARQRPMRDV